ncbi:MAG: HK97 family phage prohead protease [Burkholderiales bacterium]
MLRFDADTSLITAQAGNEDEPARIAGIAVPWDVIATVSDGQQVRFARGAFDTGQKPAKLIENHDLTQLRGVVDTLVDGDDGLEFEATLADTRASRDAVALLKAGAYDAVSVGAQPTKFTTNAEGVMTVTEATLVELSLVAVPAFQEAVITQVAATAEPIEAEPEQDTEQDTDNTEQEQNEMSEAKIEAEPIEAEATIPTQPILYAAKPELPTAVEYLSAMYKGGHEFERVQLAVRAAAPEIGTGDTPGILPEPILGPVYNNFLGIRPVVDAIGVKAMPGGGKVFIRPEVTTHTSIAEQAAEFDTLQSGTLVVTDNQVTKKTYGGYVQISEQDLDWTDPAILSIVLDDLGRVYAQQTDNAAADALVAGATNTTNFTVANIADPNEWVSWMYLAAEAIVGASNGNLPTHLFLSPNMWRSIGKLVDSQDRPLFPQVGPMNAYGQMSPGSYNDAVVFGLRVVVDRNFADDTVIIGEPSGYELFEQQKGAITTDNPSELSRTLAFRGYFSTLMIDPSKFRKAAFV